MDSQECKGENEVNVLCVKKKSGTLKRVSTNEVSLRLSSLLDKCGGH